MHFINSKYLMIWIQEWKKSQFAPPRPFNKLKCTIKLSKSQVVRISGSDYILYFLKCFNPSIYKGLTSAILFDALYRSLFILFYEEKILCEHFPFNLTLRKRKQSLVPKDLLVQWLADFL